MTRLVQLGVALAPALVAGVAAAHPGHGATHVLHDGDAALGWWVVGIAAAASMAVWLRGKLGA